MTGHPGVCLNLERVLRSDGAAGFGGLAVRIHVRKNHSGDTLGVEPEALWGSWWWYYHTDDPPGDPPLKQIKLNGETCDVLSLEFPVYNKKGERIGKQKLEVVFTDHLLSPDSRCATIGADGKVVGE